jgi:hypothetical protein
VFGGSPCGYGYWAECILDDPQQARELIAVLQAFIDSRGEQLPVREVAR